MENFKDDIISYSGLNDNDIIFVEYTQNEEWIFELDYNNPKYSAAKSNLENYFDPLNYQKYWESIYHRPFSCVENRIFSVPEYQKILTNIEWLEEKRKKAIEEIEQNLLDPDFVIESHKKHSEQSPLLEPIPMMGNNISETNMEINGTSEANATNETSDGVEINKDLQYEKEEISEATIPHISLSGMHPESSLTPLQEESQFNENIEVCDTKVTLRIPNLLLSLTPSPSKSTPNKTKKKTKKKNNTDKQESPISISSNKSHVKSENNLTISPFRKHPGKPNGIQNIGNTCYLASSIQCLRHTKELYDFLMSEELSKSLNGEKANITVALSKFMGMFNNEGMSVTPAFFKRIIDINTKIFPLHKQHDAQEFLTFLIDRLHDEMLMKNSIIENTFYGKFRSKIQCSECNFESISIEPFMCISLPIDGAMEELNFTIQMRTNHLYCLCCKFDDECFTISNLKSEIKKQLILADIEIYLINSKNEIELINENEQIGKILNLNGDWEFYAIEKNPLDALENQTLVRINLGKQNMPLLLSFDKEIINDQIKLRETLKKLIADPFATEIDLNSSQYNFTIQEEQKWKMTSSGIKYIEIEVRASSRHSKFYNITSNLIHRDITILRYSTAHDFGTLEGCMKSFTGEEKLHGNNQWECEKCKKHTDAHKILEYMNLPKVLIFHLKRFKTTKRNRMKISKMVKFPEKLQISSTNSKSPYNYKLYGIINHTGEIERGHYTATCRVYGESKEWMQFDDNKVTMLDKSEIETPNAYVLFYEQELSSSRELTKEFMQAT